MVVQTITVSMRWALIILMGLNRPNRTTSLTVSLHAPFPLACVQFMRYLFHELRVPLNTVFLGLEELSQTVADDAHAADTVELLHSSAFTMGKLFDDFLSE